MTPEGQLVIEVAVRLDVAALSESMTEAQIAAIMEGIAKVLASSGNGKTRDRP